MKADSQAKPHLIYLHIPKAGGSTLTGVLRRYYHQADVFQIRRPWKETTAEFIEMPAAKRADIRLLAGHMPFGMHLHFTQPSDYITVLRRPVDRVVSHYYFARKASAHVLHEAAKRVTLDEYVGSGMSLEMDNGQVRLLSGHDEDIPLGKCGRELLDEAKRNLRDHFLVAGLVERFDESLLLMRRKLGWKAWPVYLKRNVTSGRPEADTLSSDTIALIDRYNELDRELYEWAAQRFRADLDEARVQWQLPLFQALNSIYARRASVARVARRLVRAK
jgi:Galactose-3-O-sulfotransferase